MGAEALLQKPALIPMLCPKRARHWYVLLNKDIRRSHSFMIPLTIKGSLCLYRPHW